jgi:hypothetical protein
MLYIALHLEGHNLVDRKVTTSPEAAVRHLKRMVEAAGMSLFLENPKDLDEGKTISVVTGRTTFLAFRAGLERDSHAG